VVERHGFGVVKNVVGPEIFALFFQDFLFVHGASLALSVGQGGALSTDSGNELNGWMLGNPFLWRTILERILYP
jgi:hypothetical protein